MCGEYTVGLRFVRFLCVARPLPTRYVYGMYTVDCDNDRTLNVHLPLAQRINRLSSVSLPHV